MLCTKIVFFDIQNNICTQHVVNLYFFWNSMNNLSSYCGLTGARMIASEKDLPVRTVYFTKITDSVSQNEPTTRLYSKDFVCNCKF